MDGLLVDSGSVTNLFDTFLKGSREAVTMKIFKLHIIMKVSSLPIYYKLMTVQRTV